MRLTSNTFDLRSSFPIFAFCNFQFFPAFDFAPDAKLDKVNLIESPKNPRVKALVKLRERRMREAQGKFIIEGIRELGRAVQAQVTLETLYLCPAFVNSESWTLLNTLQTPKTELSKQAFGKVSLRQNPDGVLAVAVTPSVNLEDLNFSEDALVLVLDGLEKPGNLGALLRTADAADVSAVLVSGAGTDLYNPNVVRSSVGSVFSRPTLSVDEQTLSEFLRVQGFKLVAAMPDAQQNYWQADLSGKVAIVLGTEHDGLSEHWQRAATVQVSIPMYGLADSLNVATSGALFMYEVLRQRK